MGQRMGLYNRWLPDKLKSFVNAYDAVKSPQTNTVDFYLAQLLHYGLPLTLDVPVAVQCFKDAFKAADGDVKVPQCILDVEAALKKEYMHRKSVESAAKEKEDLRKAGLAC
jgi:hypothetical protein